MLSGVDFSDAPLKMGENWEESIGVKHNSIGLGKGQFSYSISIACVFFAVL